MARIGTPMKADTVSGFSLVEICLALLVVTLGLLAVFGLFPSGLQANESSTADTRIALFAERVFDGMRANTLTMTTTNDTDLIQGLGLTSNRNFNATATPYSRDKLRYRLILVETNAPVYNNFLLINGVVSNYMAGKTIYAAKLDVWDGLAGPEHILETFYSEFTLFGE